MKLIIVFAVTVICTLVVVISSSGISQFKADREVSMQVADYENALIALPESITLNIKILRLSTNVYTKEKKLKRTEEIVQITDVDHNLTIKNNMAQPIYLDQIHFDNLNFQFQNNGLSLGINENVKVDFTNSFDGNDFMSSNNKSTESKATLYFRWDNGNINIQKNVIINTTIIEEAKDQTEV
ncbi:hypothetical protein [Lederbergia panacisoli]|uniref:hypothetical protein n=1 Tax=Lederbergia panacisoli TaxID=1255251 RepID=UPI00214B2406|nr:hypothetical protein [Lederbergia panacisoli]MCR2823285.1 hypothetical protein [Lederbergia panacisoli]